MMRTAGVFLIVAAVALRGALIFRAEPQFGVMIGLFAAYGLLLLAATWLARRTFGHGSTRMKHGFLSFFSVKIRDIHGIRVPYVQLAYLLLQSAIVIALLVVSTYEDFIALLFVPLSLDAVSFFGRRFGFLCIAAISLAMVGTFLFSDEGRLFGLAMGVLYSGLCFLFGGYAYQVRKAEAAHDQNRRTFAELQAAHRQLQGYADQVANLAVEQERNRLARELHDSVTQTVFSMNLVAQSARLLLNRDSARAAGQLLRIEELAANALAEIQSLVAQLRPRSVAEEGLPTALRRLAAERQARDGLQISLEVNGEKTLSKVEAVGLYAIAQEALTNVAKHSGARQATVRLNLQTGASYLEVEDRGAGFDTQAAPHQLGHLGLAGMAERAREIGWSLAVESWRGQGTRIRVAENPSGGAP
jgi:signal transduction histidine kinase